jgi:hypothetical protein
LWRQFPLVKAGGFDVRLILVADADRPWLIEQINAAFEIISRSDSNRFLRMRRDVTEVNLVGRPVMGKRGAYDPSGVYIDATELLRLGKDAALDVASTLVHEATHARLFRAGFGFYFMHREVSRIRVERICNRAQHAFLCRLPDNEKRRRLLADLDHVFELIPSLYSDDAVVEGLRGRIGLRSRRTDCGT